MPKISSSATRFLFGAACLAAFHCAQGAAASATQDFAPLIMQDADPSGTHQGLTEFRSANGRLNVQMAAVYATNDVNGASMPTNPALGDPVFQYLYPRLAFSCSDSSHQVTSFAGPLLRVFPGDTVHIQFTNSLVTQRTNLHFHGFSVAPNSLNSKGTYGDFVGLPYVQGAAPGSSRIYEFTVPKNQLPGPYWYHAHAHGVAEMQVACGLSGAFYVEGAVPAYVSSLAQRSAPIVSGKNAPAATAAKETIAEVSSSLSQLPHHLLVLKDFWTPAFKPINGPLEQTVNGKITYSNQTAGSPYVIQYGGADQIWEITNQSANLHYALKINGISLSSFGFYVIGRDGMPGAADISPIVPDHALMIPPAGRATVIVPTSLLSGQTLTITAQQVNTQEDNYFQVGQATNQNPNPWNLISLAPGGGSAPAGVTPWPQLAAQITQTLSATPNAAASETSFIAKHEVDATYVFDQPDADTTGQLPLEPAKFTLYRLADKFGSYVKGPSDAYENYEPPIAHLIPGKAQRWIIENVTPEWHVFHIHQVHFLVERFTSITDADNPGSNQTAPVDNQGIPFYATNEPPPAGVGKTVGEPYYSGEVDTVTIPGNTQAWLTLPLTEGSQIDGDFVMHCHLLEHEDNGMMANVTAGNTPEKIVEATPSASHLPPLELAAVRLPKPAALEDSKGKECNSDIFRANDFSLVTFGYTTCEGACPMTVETCTAALDKLKTGEQARVSPFFVSIDVDRDNAEKLAGYMHEHEMAGSWKALLDKNLTASRAFGARREVTRAKDGEISIRHTTTIYLIDRNMRIRAAFDPEEGADEISQRIEKELRNG